MRALRFALVLAAVAGVTISTLDVSAFAKGTGGAAGGAGGAAGGTGGGASGGGASGGGSSGGGANPALGGTFNRVPPLPYPHLVRYVPPHVWSSCFKQGELYDRYGYAVINTHGAECFE